MDRRPAVATTRRGLLITAGTAVFGALASRSFGRSAPRFWVFGASIAGTERHTALEDRRPPGSRIANAMERQGLASRNLDDLSCNQRYDLLTFQSALNEGLPPPHLQLVEPGYAPDYIHSHGVRFVSRRLRDALALPAKAVSWLDVNMDGSTQVAKAQDYRHMLLQAAHDVINPSRADYETHEIPCRDGGVFRRKMARRIYWRRDARPEHELFWAHHSNLMVATDALAARVLSLGTSDIAFFDQERMQELYDADGVSRIIVKQL